MTDAREKIADIFKSTLEFDGVVYNEDQTIDAILLALPSIVREMIPDLQWETANETMYWCEADFGRYAVWETFEGEGYLQVPKQGCGNRVGIGGLNQAKARANEHHKQQILKAMGMSE